VSSTTARVNGHDHVGGPEPTHRHVGVWTLEMRNILLADYQEARARGTLPALAAKLGVDLYQLYSQAHRLGLARGIRRR